MDVRFVGLSLHEAIALLEDDENLEATDVFIEPPAAAVVSDEDSGDEDDGGTMNNFNGRQLNAPCEVVLARSSDFRQTYDADFGIPSSSPAEDDPVPKKKTKTSASKASAKTSKTLVQRSSWSKTDIKTKQKLFPDPNFSQFRGKNPVELFELFFDESIVEFLVDQSNNYAMFLNAKNPEITVQEMKAFVGILILSGYNTLPGKRFYWDERTDTRNELVYRAMRRNRFFTIMRFFHCTDNINPQLDEKMWKIRPLITMLQTNFKKYFVPLRKLNFDESMIEYYGKHRCKQFLRDKPIRFGYENWCLNTPNGYLVAFELYQGRSRFCNEQYEAEFGKAAAPLVVMLDGLPDSVTPLPFEIYIDNLFTGLKLMAHIPERGYECTGTIRENRLPRDIPLTGKNEMKSLQRGSYEVVQNDQGIAVVRWVDNSVVTAASTCYGVEPLDKVCRYNREKKKKVQVSRPAIFSEYNSGMVGTDLMDENINRFRVGIRGKKWWWPIATYLLDVCVNNAWVLSKESGAHMTQLEFKRTVAQPYLGRYHNPPKTGGRPRTSHSATGVPVPDFIRYDGANHFLKPTDHGSRRRCALDTCTSRTRSEYCKCDVGLCLGCNIDFHVKKV